MYQGTNASSGIGIGTAVIVEEAELVIKREAVVDAEAEVKRFQDALEQTCLLYTSFAICVLLSIDRQFVLSICYYEYCNTNEKKKKGDK